MASGAYTHPLRVADLAARKPTRFDLKPTADQRAAIADALGILGIGELRLKGEIRPMGRHDWDLSADLTAVATQACVVTLAPVTTPIAETVRRRYLHDLPEPTAEEMEVPEDDSAEPLRAEIDLGAVLTESLALALPLYPRAEGAELGAADFAEPGTEALTDETVRPFAGLANLLARGAKDEPEGGSN